MLIAERPILSPFTMARSMKADAAGPKRLSEKRYQITAWVSAMATIIKNPNEGNQQTSQLGSDRSPQQKALGRIWQIDLAENASALWELPLRLFQQEVCQ